MPITLENRGRQMQVFNLPHELYCEKSGRCGCAQEIVNTWVEDAATGESSRVLLEKDVVDLTARVAEESARRAIASVMGPACWSLSGVRAWP